MNDAPYAESLTKLLQTEEKNWSVKSVYEVSKFLNASGVKISYVEVGVRMGKSFLYFLLGCQNDFEKAALIDPWEKSHIRTQKIMQKFIVSKMIDLSENREKVMFMPVKSDVALPRLQGDHHTFNMGLIDGDHDPEVFEYDLIHTWPIIEEGGYLIIDDLEWKEGDGILKKYEQFLQDNRDAVEEYRYIGEGLQGVGILRKKSPK